MSDDRIEWLSWSSDAFGRAAREEKPVLLSITATWCRACHEMDRTTYVDARVVSSVQAGFVAVRVDADRRPDINERYNLGGWPTTAFLTPHGDLLGGGTFVAPDQMVGILDRVRDALRGRGDEIERAQARAATTAPESTAPSLSLDQIVELVFASFDEDHGGFGVAPKFPLTAPLHLALEIHRTNGDDWSRRVVERTLDAIRDGGLHDVEHGGFFRYATTREWQLPHVEKLLETNALLLRIYAESASTLDRDVDREVAAELATYITGRLGGAAGGYCGSEDDTTVYADTSATASAALLSASSALNDQELGRTALEQLERVLLTSYRPGKGIAHCTDGASRVAGLLADYVAVIHALLDAHQVSDAEPYEMLAQELAHYLLQTMWDGRSGGFFDRTHEPAELGLLRSPRKPFAVNCEAARAFARLARVSFVADFRSSAEDAIRVVAPFAATQGPLAAHYVLALRELSAK